MAGGIWRQNQHILWKHSTCQSNLLHGHASFLTLIFSVCFPLRDKFPFFFPTFFALCFPEKQNGKPCLNAQCGNASTTDGNGWAGLVALAARTERLQLLPDPAPGHICVAHSHSSAVPSPLTRERGPAHSPQQYINLLLFFLEASSWQTPLFAVPKESVSRVFTESCRIWLLHAVCVQGML